MQGFSVQSFRFGVLDSGPRRGFPGTLNPKLSSQSTEIPAACSSSASMMSLHTYVGYHMGAPILRAYWGLSWGPIILGNFPTLNLRTLGGTPNRDP